MANNNDNIDLLLKLLGKNNPPPPKTASKEELNEYIMNSLNDSQSEMLKKLMSNPSAADNFMKSPQAQEILKKINKDKGMK